MTLGLSQITNDAETTIKFIEKYRLYFDKYFVTVADKDKKEYNKLKTYFENINHPDADGLVLTYFKWKDDFAAARNFNLKSIDTKFWFWADSDDEIINPERIGELVKYCVQNNVDVVQLRYDYDQNEAGDAISDHWRERLIRRSYEGHWDAPVHETFQGPPCVAEQSEWVTVKHQKDKVDVIASMKRNKKILQKHYEKTKDPRDAQYLGMAALAEGDDKLAIQYFLQHIKTSGSDQDMYRSWCRIAEAEWKGGNYDQALYATDEAIKLRPDFPDAYHIKVMIYTTMEEYEKGIEWLEVAVNKPIPNTLNVIDPTLYKYRGLAMGAQCFLFSGRVKEAYKLYQEVLRQAPNFFKDIGKIDEVDWDSVFENAYFDQKALDYAKWLLHYIKGNGGKPQKIFESLPARIFSDVRLNAERAEFLPKKKWPEKSIVFYCGQGTETWGPDTLDKGMGGSEEAVVYLSRELAKLGWQVTVFNEREEEYWDDLKYIVDSDKEAEKMWETGELDGKGVQYKPWTLFNPWDEFDVFVGWRMPGFTRDIKARLKVLDMHDMPQGAAQITNSTLENTDKIMFKSKYHAAQAKVPKDKEVIIGHGIKDEY